MTEPSRSSDGEAFVANALEAAVRIAVLALMAAWCFQIVRPFITPIVWGVIIAVAVHPGYRWLLDRLGGRRGLAGALFTLLALVVLITPTLMLSTTLIETSEKLAAQLHSEALHVPAPPDRVATWPVVGESLHRFWTLANENLEAALVQIRPQLAAFGRWLLAAAAGAGFAILQFIAAIVIAGVLITQSERGHHVAHSFARRLAGDRGETLADLSETMVRSVAQGILGVAVIQSTLAGLGFLAVGVPGAGLLTLSCLILSVIQIGPALVLIGVVIWVFSTASSVTAVLFLVWSIFVAVIDNFLKPLFLGRGVDVPTVVIFIGAIGGFLSMGIIGLFVGSVVLVLGYTLFSAWLVDGRHPVPTEDAESSASGL